MIISLFRSHLLLFTGKRKGNEVGWLIICGSLYVQQTTNKTTTQTIFFVTRTRNENTDAGTGETKEKFEQKKTTTGPGREKEVEIVVEKTKKSLWN